MPMMMLIVTIITVMLAVEVKVFTTDMSVGMVMPTTRAYLASVSLTPPDHKGVKLDPRDLLSVRNQSAGEGLRAGVKARVLGSGWLYCSFA